MFASVLVSDDSGASFVHPFVTVSVIEVPVSVDKMLHRFRADCPECVADLLLRSCEARVDENFAITAGKDCNIATCAQEHADISSELLNRELGSCAFLSGAFDEVAFLCPETTWKKPGSRNCKASRGDKVPTRDIYRRFGDHI